MDIEVTPEAAEALARSLELGGVDVSAGGGVRLRMAKGLGGGEKVQVELADGPSEGESVSETQGVRLFLDPSLTDAIDDPIVALDPQHDTIVVRPRT